ncbi:PREDICTED: pre-mRNA-splicing factor 38A [Rhagoletis zephyria]|uniref:pre-mRNA-splicing factor 38A n=1 Tax=Rhagoletis zephyria TaxID=28612 RepID=UPI00081165D0|nr:PREDICTED: pre-mRNA-splicing factor 38A [Rhagoletis zephyria]
MANRTVKEAKNIHGTNPQYLVEKIIRSRIYDSKYWKEQCFALTAELLVDKAMELRFIGGVYGGNIKPTQFLCLTLKMLQIQPEKDIVVEFIKNEEFKYVRALGAFYLRLTGSALDCYKYLEPLYNDNRKLRRQNRAGQYEIVHMDDFIDELLRSDRVCDIILPRIQKRAVLEENNELEPKVSALDEDLDDDVVSDEDGGGERDHDKNKSSFLPKRRIRKDHSRSRSRSASASRDARGGRSRDYDTDLEDYGRPRDRERDRFGVSSTSSSSRHWEDRGGGGSSSYRSGRDDYRDEYRREDYKDRRYDRDSRNERDRRRH